MGQSSIVTYETIEGKFQSAAELAEYLTHFRADNIVRDAEEIRKVKCPSYRVRYSVQFRKTGNWGAPMVERTFMSRAVLGAVWEVGSNWVI
jgi:hypothetical protein